MLVHGTVRPHQQPIPFVLIAQKTGRRRVVPLQPKLYELLLGAFEQAEEGEERICPISRHCLWRNFRAIRKRAGLDTWKDAFQVMRRNCETDWTQEYPQYAVSNWISHDIKVSGRHYLQIPEKLYDRAAAPNAAQTATKTATKPIQRANTENTKKTLIAQGLMPLSRTGLEPVTSCVSSRRSSQLS